MLLAASTISGSLPSRGDDELEQKQRCVDDSTEGQRLRSEHRLGAAKKRFVACASEACPAPVRKACGGWLAEVDAAIPSIVPKAKDASGNDVVAVRVLVDGVLVTSQADGRAIELDPGKHDVRFEHLGDEPMTQTVVLAEGEKRRAVSVTFAARVDESKPKPALPEPSRGVAPWVFASVAGVGLVSFAVFGAIGRSEILSLRERCPSCTQDEVDAARRKLLIADVSLGVAVVAAGLSTWLFVRTPSPVAQATLVVDPLRGLALGSIVGRF